MMKIYRNNFVYGPRDIYRIRFYLSIRVLIPFATFYLTASDYA